MEKDKLKRLKIIICLIIIVVSLVTGIRLLVFFREIKLPTLNYTNSEYLYAFDKLYKDFDFNMPSKTKQEYKEQLENELNFKHYIYFERNPNFNGWQNVVIPTIIINEELSEYDYCRILTHEIMHFKKFSANETYVSFETFKYLYENECEYLHNVGVLYGINQVYNHSGGEYDISGLIVNYLTNN